MNPKQFIKQFGKTLKKEDLILLKELLKNDGTLKIEAWCSNSGVSILDTTHHLVTFSCNNYKRLIYVDF
jgi:hypothetical protein